MNSVEILFMKNWTLLLLALLISTGCSISADVSTVDTTPPADIVSNSPTIVDSQLPAGAFFEGETSVSSNGYKVNGVFNELSEKTTSSSGYIVQGAFYE